MKFASLLFPLVLFAAWPLAAADPDPITGFLQPNIEDKDGTPAYVHVTETDMPLRVSIGYPKTAPRYASRQQGRETSIEAIRLWETAIQKELPWFKLEFVEDDDNAAVQVQWKRRIDGPWGGFGGVRYSIANGKLRVGGKMEVSTTPMGSYGPDATLSLDEVRLLMAHEFGHVL